MSDADCSNERVGRHDAGALAVRDAMVARPKTLPADASVAELRRLFSNGHVLTALLVDGVAFAGAIDRDELSADERDDRPARELASCDVATVEPDAPLAEALERLDEGGERRLVVLDADGRTLRGLLCLTTDRDGFCQS
jgi:CBS domain-containing protein